MKSLNAKMNSILRNENDFHEITFPVHEMKSYFAKFPSAKILQKKRKTEILQNFWVFAKWNCFSRNEIGFHENEIRFPENFFAKH